MILAVVLAQLGGGQTFAEAAIRAAQAGPRLLVDGWEVTRVDEWDAGTGEMTFARDGRTIVVSWLPTGGPTKDLERVAAARVAGAAAWVGRYPGTSDYVARWREGDAFLQARGDAAAPGVFLETLTRIHQVGAEDWRKALPASAVEPKATSRMLAGIPLPPGFRAPPASDETRDRYQLGAKVADAINGKGDVPGGKPGLTVGGTYKNAFGC